LKDLFARRALARIGRQEHLADRESPALLQLEAEPRGLCPEELIRQLDQDAGAVTRVRIRTARGAMREPAQHLETVFDDLAGLLSGDVRDESDPAGVAKGTIVEC